MAFLGKDEILNCKDYVTKEVDVPEWGGKVLVRGMTGTERDKFESETFSQNGKNIEVNYTNMRARMLAYTVVDEEGKRIFSDSDIEKLGQKSALALSRVFEVAKKLCGLGEDDVNELIKN